MSARRGAPLVRSWLDRPELAAALSDAVAELTAGELAGVLLVGAVGSGRSSLLSAVLGATAGAARPEVLSDTGLEPTVLQRSAEEAMAVGRAFVACVSPSLGRGIRRAAGRGRRLAVIPVPPLDREETTDAVAGMLGMPASARLASEAWRQSGGSIGLVRLLVERGIATGAIGDDGDAAQLIAPLELDALQDLALPLLTALRAGARSGLDRLALIEPAPEQLAERIVGATVLAELLDAGVARTVARSAARPATVWIPAQAIADRLRQDASSELRAAVHRQVLGSPVPWAADGWQGLGRARSLLWWFEQGLPGPPPLPPPLAVTAANRTHRPGIAAALTTCALAIGSDPELLRERAFARRFTGDVGGALEDLRRLHDEHAEPAAVVGMADVLHYEHGDADEAIRLLAAGIASATEQTVREELEAAKVTHLAYGGRFDECERAYRALPPGPVRIRGRADVAHAMVESHRGRTTQALRTLYRSALTPAADAPVWYAEELQGALFIGLLQAHGPRRTLTATGILGSTEADPFVRFDEVSVLTARMSVLLAQGHAADALRLGLSVEASGEQDRSGFGAHALALGAEAAAYLGDERSSRRLEARFHETPERAAGILRPNSDAALCAAALLRGDAGAAERTREIATALAEGGLFAVALRVAQAGLRVGDVGCAALAVRWASEANGAVSEVFAEHGRALVEASPVALVAVAERYLGLGFTLHAAEAFQQAASLCAAQGMAELGAEAASRTRLLLSLADGIRAAHLARADQPPVALSRREREIAVLVSQGASNRSIAQALVLSVRTVEGHLGRMYAKLGVADRRELARHVRRGGVPAK